MQGQVIKGRYRIDKVIGRGGMATVYVAFDSILSRQVAIKILHRQFTHNTHFIERFKREAYSVANLIHPNITSIYDTGYADDVHYIVMEYVEGKTLKQIIEQRAPLPINEAIDITRQIAEALGHAHNRGIIHRDVKPQNILITEDLIVKVTDFGIARALAMPSLTQTGKVLGTARYISPEQAKGQQADQRSDIYSLGVILYELVTAHPPFEGSSSVDIAEKHVMEVPRSPRELNPKVPPTLEIITAKLLKKDQDDRYQDVAGLLDDLSFWESPEKRDLMMASLASKSERRPRKSKSIKSEKSEQRSRKSRGRKRPLSFKKISIALGVVVLLGAASSYFTGVGDPEKAVKRYGGEIRQGNFKGEKVAALVPVEVVDYDPDGNGDENPGKTGNIFDNNPLTSWSTETYRSADFNGLKNGVGIYIDYGKNVVLKEFSIVSAGGWSGELKGSNDILNWTTLKEVEDADKKLSLRISAEPYRYYLIWIDKLARSHGNKYGCKIYEAKALGSAF